MCELTGMVMPMMAVKMSGRSRAASYAIWAPQSCLVNMADKTPACVYIKGATYPTAIAVGAPACSRIHRRSPTRSGIVPDDLTSPGCVDGPNPRRSGAMMW